MEYKEFIQAVDSLTNEALVSKAKILLFSIIILQIL